MKEIGSQNQRQHLSISSSSTTMISSSPTTPNSLHCNKETIEGLISMKDQQEIHDTISAMLKQEVHYLSNNYLKVSKIGISDRAKVCKWVFDIVDRLKLHRETAIVAINYLDRVCSSTSSSRAAKARSDRNEYQLVAVSSLFIAIKILEVNILSADMLSYITKNMYTKDEITSCEEDILSALEWKMFGPTSVQFVDYILALLPGDMIKAKIQLRDESYRQLTTTDYGCVPLRRSSLALAAILNSLEHMHESILSFDMKYRYLEIISMAFDIDNVQTSPLIKAVRGRLHDMMLTCCQQGQKKLCTEQCVQQVRRISIEESDMSSARAA